MGKQLDILRQRWRTLRDTARFHDAVLFLIFVGISTLFWVILALNDNAQDSFNVRVSITNVPDSVTFISDIPEKFHVGVSDKGTTLWRNHYRHPTLSINFRNYSDKGILMFSKADMESALKGIFGTSSTITSSSLDSLRLVYTTNKGKRVPIMISSNITPASGSIIEGNLQPSPSNVYVFGEPSVLDTIHAVQSDLITLKDLTETTTVKAYLKKIRNARVVPSVIEVTVPVEPLVKKEAMISLSAVNVPKGKEMLLFPSKVPVDYYVAMSRLNDNDDPSIELQVDYRGILESNNGKLRVRVVSYPERLQNLSLKTDSVEYTIVQN